MPLAAIIRVVVMIEETVMETSRERGFNVAVLVCTGSSELQATE